jgi:hypothetical protein
VDIPKQALKGLKIGHRKMIVTIILYLQILLYQSTMLISLGFNNPIRCTIFIGLLYNYVPASEEKYMHSKVQYKSIDKMLLTSLALQLRK